MSSDAFAKIGALGKKAMKGANDLRSKVNSLDSMGGSHSFLLCDCTVEPSW